MLNEGEFDNIKTFAHTPFFLKKKKEHIFRRGQIGHHRKGGAKTRDQLLRDENPRIKHLKGGTLGDVGPNWTKYVFWKHTRQVLMTG